ncbi:50S ribosomal protein L25/general stress protein Ctc [Candidatus Curtissbacteria bacterium]|nr:50S ribosomal protein L25/general stress protein Ctc [Candidatus Curtissbacteria bacterium]
MEQVSLKAQKRTVLGRKVKALRREGITPAHVFGHKIKTVHVQVKAADFAKVYDAAGETGIINLAVDGQNRPVLVRNVQVHPVSDIPLHIDFVRNVQVHPVSDIPLHIDFYQVNLTEKVKVNVPLEVVGESPVVEKKLGLLLTPVTELEIETFPADIPEKIEVDIARLENVGDEVKVKDLAIDRQKIEVHADPELVVAQIGELVTREMEAVEAEIEAEQAEVAAETKEAEEEKAAEAPEEAAAEGEPRPEGREEAKEETPQKEAQQVQEEPE